MKFLFYVEGTKESGLGHLRRCEALAQEFVRRGWRADFLDTSVAGTEWLTAQGWAVHAASNVSPSSYDAMVIDSYKIPADAVRAFRKSCPRLIGFHDSGEPNKDFSLLISSVYSEDTVLGSTQILGGSQYKIIHHDFLTVPKIAVRDHVSSVVITFGGAPAVVVPMRRIAERLRRECPDVDVRIVAGISGSDTAAIFASADVAISGGGQTMFELLYLGMPTIVIVISEDQESQVARAAQYGGVRIAGHIHDTDLSERVAESARALYSADARRALHDRAAQCVDGRGAERIATFIEKSLSQA